MRYLLLIFFFQLFTAYSQNQEEYKLIEKYSPVFENILHKQKASELEHDVVICNEIKELVKKNSNEYFQSRMKLILADQNINFDLKETNKILSELKKYVTNHKDYYHLQIHYNSILIKILFNENKYNDILKLYNEDSKHFKDYKKFDRIWEFEKSLNVYYIQTLIEQNKFNEALNILLKLEKTVSKTDVDYYTYILASIGAHHFRVDNIAEAIKYLKKAELILEKNPNFSNFLVSVYNKIGMVYLKNNDQQKSLISFEKGYQLAKKIKSNTYIITVGQNLAQAYNTNNEIAKAKSIIIEVIEIINKNDFIEEKANSYKTLAEIQLKCNEIKSGLLNIEKAIVFLNNNKSEYSLKTLSNILSIKQQLLEKDNNFKEAYLTSLRLIKLKDTLGSITNAEELSKNLVVYETEKKENQIVILKQKEDINNLQINKQKNQIVILIIILLALLILATLIIFYSRKINRVKNFSLRAQLMRSQFNPHYINNAFSTLQASLTKEKFDEKIINYTSYVSRFSRLLLESTFNEEWSLLKEKEIIENYLKTQQYRLENIFCFTFNSDFTKEEMSKIKLPSAITQTVLENAIEHSGFNKNNTGEIYINIEKKSSQFIIVIKNKIAEEPVNLLKRMKDEPSRGLEITNKRMLLYKKIYKKPTKFTFLKNDVEAIVTFELPIIYL